MEKFKVICFTFLSFTAFGQRGSPLDAFEYKSDPWSPGNLIIWLVIIVALGYSAAKAIGKAEAEKEIRDKNKGGSFFSQLNSRDETPLVYKQKEQTKEINTVSLKQQDENQSFDRQVNITPPEKVVYFDYSDKYHAEKVYIEFIATKSKNSFRGFIGNNAVLGHDKYLSWAIDYEVSPIHEPMSTHTKLKQLQGKSDLYEVIESGLFFKEIPVKISGNIACNESLILTQETVGLDLLGKCFRDYNTNRLIFAHWNTTRINLIFEGGVKI